MPLDVEASIPLPPGFKRAMTKDGKPVAEESQSFLRKYWYIIAIVVLMQLFTTADEGAAPAGTAAPAAPAVRG